MTDYEITDDSDAVAKHWAEHKLVGGVRCSCGENFDWAGARASEEVDEAWREHVEATFTGGVA